MAHLIERHPELSVDHPYRGSSAYSREVELLLCCRSGEAGDTADRMRSLVEEGIDWDRLLELARWHKLLPLLCLNLGRLKSPLVPGEVSDLLDRVFRMNAGRSLGMVAELLAILDSLEERGVEAIPYKGPALAERLYGNLALRESSDLDLLVERDHVEVARQILLDRGYTSSVSLRGANRRFLLESRYSERFDKPDGLIVELHWAFTNKDVAFPLGLEDLRPRLDAIFLGGRRLQVFSREDSLLILCVHGAKHMWNRLEWILGIAELAEEEIDWSLLWSRAKRTGSERMLLLGLALAHEIYDVSIPREMMKKARSIKTVQELVSEVKEDLAAEEMIAERDESNNLRYDLFHYRLGDRFRDRLRYISYRLTTPSHAEYWSSITIGGHRIALHAFVRPFRLLSKFLSLLQSKAMRAFRNGAGTSAR